VKKLTPIFTGQFDSFVWIRPDGRGTFQESPLVKNFVEDQPEEEVTDFVVDLEKCPGMDSTFMGMLAGLGIGFRKRGKGQLSFVGTTGKTKASLMELGLHYLSTIEPEEGPWQGKLAEIRANLALIEGSDETNKEEHVLECHENLCEADESNLEKFQTVLDMMGSKLATQPADKPGSAR